jgi:hypothetical protein
MAIHLLDGATPSRLERLVDDYLNHCQARGLAPRTLENSYGYALHVVFLPWCASEGIRDVHDLDGRALDQSVRDNLRVKEVRVESTPDRRWIVCHNPAEAERDKATRDTAIARLVAELETIAAARARDAANANKTKTKRKPSDDAHRKAECALRDHRTLGRYLRQTPSGRLQIDHAAIKAEPT